MARIKQIGVGRKTNGAVDGITDVIKNNIFFPEHRVFENFLFLRENKI